MKPGISPRVPPSTARKSRVFGVDRKICAAPYKNQETHANFTTAPHFLDLRRENSVTVKPLKSAPFSINVC